MDLVAKVVIIDLGNNPAEMLEIGSVGRPALSLHLACISAPAFRVPAISETPRLSFFPNPVQLRRLNAQAIGDDSDALTIV